MEEKEINIQQTVNDLLVFLSDRGISHNNADIIINITGQYLIVNKVLNTMKKELSRNIEQMRKDMEEEYDLDRKDFHKDEETKNASQILNIIERIFEVKY